MIGQGFEVVGNDFFEVVSGKRGVLSYRIQMFCEGDGEPMFHELVTMNQRPEPFEVYTAFDDAGPEFAIVGKKK